MRLVVVLQPGTVNSEPASCTLSWASKSHRSCFPGGHCKPITSIGYRRNAEKHGHKVANSLYEYEEAAIHHYLDIVTREGIDCDLHVTRAFDALYDPVDAENSRLDFEARKKHHPESFRKGDVRLTEDLTSQTGVKKAKFSANYPAGHLWPYKLATGRE